MKKALWALVVGFTVLALASPDASAARWDPPDGAASIRLRAGCFIDGADWHRGWADVTSTVKYVTGKSAYYQQIQIKMQIKLLSGGWREVDQANFVHGDYRRAAVGPWGAAVRDETVISRNSNSDTRPHRAEVRIQLRKRRRGPDPIVWRYTEHTNHFICREWKPGA